MMRHDTLYDRDGKPLPEDWYLDENRRQYKWATQQRVARTTLQVDGDDCTVSTVWLSGVDHGWMPDEPPILFETMVFGTRWDQELARYSTEEEAMRGHLDVLDRLRAGRQPFPYLEESEATQ